VREPLKRGVRSLEKEQLMKKRTRAYMYGCSASLFLSLLLGEGLSSPLRQNPAAALEGQGISLSEVLKLPGRVLGRGHNSKPVGHNKVTTYLVEEVTLPHPVEVEIRGNKKRVTRAFRVTIYGGPFNLRGLGYFIGIGDKSLGMGIEHSKLDAVTAVTFDRSLLREGATLTIDQTELPEKLKLDRAKKTGR
jgi:hypothetical protein